MTSRIRRGTALVLPAALIAGVLALGAVGVAVSAEDPCASPTTSAEPAVSSAEPSATTSAEPSATTSAEPSATVSPAPTVDPSATAVPDPSAAPTVTGSADTPITPSAEPAPVVSAPAPASADPSAYAVVTRAKDPSVPEAPAPCPDPSASSEPAALLAAAPPVLTVIPDPHDVVYGDPVPDYTFILLDSAVPESPVVVDPATLTTYIAPICSTEHLVDVPPIDTDGVPTQALSWYTDTTSVAESPLTITCTGGSADGYAFDVTATAELTIAKVVTEVDAPPAAAPLSYGQTLHDSTLTGGSARVVGSGAAVPGYFSFPLDSWTVTPLVGTQSHVVAFVPEDFANYEPSSTRIDVTVGQATPVIVTPPTASPLVTGQTLAESTLTGGVASTEGTFAWTSPTTVPADGATAQQVTFTPTDPANFATSPATTVDVDVTVTSPPLDYATAGYLGRVQMGAVTNLIRPRVMVPLPFTITGGDSSAGDLALVESFDPVAISCEALVDNATEIFPSVTIGRRSRLVYDSEYSQFVQFWKVPVTRNACYRVTTTIADGDTIVAYFKTR